MPFEPDLVLADCVLAGDDNELDDRLAKLHSRKYAHENLRPLERKIKRKIRSDYSPWMHPWTFSLRATTT